MTKERSRRRSMETFTPGKRSGDPKSSISLLNDNDKVELFRVGGADAKS